MKNFKNSEAIIKAMDIIYELYDGEDKHKLLNKLYYIAKPMRVAENKEAKSKAAAKRLKAAAKK